MDISNLKFWRATPVTQNAPDAHAKADGPDVLSNVVQLPLASPVEQTVQRGPGYRELAHQAELLRQDLVQWQAASPAGVKVGSLAHVQGLRVLTTLNTGALVASLLLFALVALLVDGGLVQAGVCDTEDGGLDSIRDAHQPTKGTRLCGGRNIPCGWSRALIAASYS